MQMYGFKRSIQFFTSRFYHILVFQNFFLLNINILTRVVQPLQPFFLITMPLLCNVKILEAMNSEILVIKKDDLVDLFEQFSKKIANGISIPKPVKTEQTENPRVRRLTTRQIKDMLGVSDTTFERIQDELPLHRTKTGRLFGYEHDIFIYLFQEHPPYFDYTQFRDYIKEENLLKHISSK